MLAVNSPELHYAIMQRMGMTNPRESLIWERNGAEMVVFMPMVRLTGGYLTAQFHVETVETGIATVDFVFFLGDADTGANKAASVTHDANAPDVIMDTWGETMRSVVWEGVLDVIEGAAVAVSDASGIPLCVLGFTGGEDRILIAVGT